MDLENIWNVFLAKVEEKVKPVLFETWFKDTKLIKLTDDTATIKVSWEVQKKHLKDNYNELIKETFMDVTGSIFNFEYTTEEEEIKQEEFIKENNEAIFDSGLDSKYTFDNFIIGNNNRFAQATAYSIKDNLGLTNPLYIYGGVGLGKTHLMQAIGNAVIDEDPSKKVFYCTGELFVNELIKVMLNPKNADLNDSFKKKFRNSDLLLIDDVQIIAGKDKCQEEFFHTFNALRENNSQIILTSDKAPKEIHPLTERLESRFVSGLLVDISSADYETRLAILKKRAEEERYLIEDDILIKVATKVKSNVRELEGVFNKLMAYTKFTNNPLTDPVVDNIIESILVKNSNILSSTLVMQVVAKFFNLKVSDLTSDKRSNTIAYPRQIAMYLCREVADMSFPSIGKDFGGRDHSTVLHAYSKIKDEYDNNPDTKDLIDDIKKTLEREG